MNRRDVKVGVVALLLAGVSLLAARDMRDKSAHVPPGKHEVVFWHFWGGKDRSVVEDIVARFNASQSVHFVRAIAMPGNNLDLKFFLGVAGGDPPDVLNQDDPIVTDWALRRALVPLDELATNEEYAALGDWLFPAARQIGTANGRLYALCNGLDVRALYCDARVMEEFGISPPTTIAELDAAAEQIAPPGIDPRRKRYGFLPDPRRIWAWGTVFGGEFYDATTGDVTADSEPIVRALDWMKSYSEKYGAEEVLRFRKGDQALAGASFPLLEGRYAMIMDGQWRVAEMSAAREVALRSGKPEPRYYVVPLPAPNGGKRYAGWVNGNFFVVPRGAKNPQGAWEFMKFWSGFGGRAKEAARACVAGGWIPASQAVVDQKLFQDFLRMEPPFATFVRLANSTNQHPTPPVPGAQFFQDTVIRAAEDAMYRGVSSQDALTQANRRARAVIVAERSKTNTAEEKP